MNRYDAVAEGPVVCPEIGAIGLVGGKVRARSLTKERRQETARKAASARWAKKQ